MKIEREEVLDGLQICNFVKNVVVRFLREEGLVGCSSQGVQCLSRLEGVFGEGFSRIKGLGVGLSRRWGSDGEQVYGSKRFRIKVFFSVREVSGESLISYFCQWWIKAVIQFVWLFWDKKKRKKKKKLLLFLIIIIIFVEIDYRI